MKTRRRKEGPGETYCERRSYLAGTIWLLLLPCTCTLVSSRVRRSIDPICIRDTSHQRYETLSQMRMWCLPLLHRNILVLHFGILVQTCVLYYHNITHLASEYLVFDAPCPLDSPLVRLVSFDIPSMLSIPHVDFPFNFLMQPSHVMLFEK